MDRQCARCCTMGGCNHCPPMPKPLLQQDSKISKKMERAHLIRLKGTFVPANRHTANLPGTMRPVIPKDASGTLIWPCNADINIGN